jgi:hypothetical protein
MQSYPLGCLGVGAADAPSCALSFAYFSFSSAFLLDSLQMWTAYYWRLLHNRAPD